MQNVRREQGRMSKSKMRPVHPAEILKEEFLEPPGITIAVLARSLNEQACDLSDLVMQKGSVSPELANKRSIYLKTSPGFWLNLQSTDDLRKAESEHGHRLETGSSQRGTADRPR
jgi:addiction module HigA family antidote